MLDWIKAILKYNDLSFYDLRLINAKFFFDLQNTSITNEFFHYEWLISYSDFKLMLPSRFFYLFVISPFSFDKRGYFSRSFRLVRLITKSLWFQPQKYIWWLFTGGLIRGLRMSVFKMINRGGSFTNRRLRDRNITVRLQSGKSLCKWIVSFC